MSERDRYRFRFVRFGSKTRKKFMNFDVNAFRLALGLVKSNQDIRDPWPKLLQRSVERLELHLQKP